MLAEARAEHWYERALAYKNEKDWINAAYCFEQVVRIEPENWRAWLFGSIAHAYLEDADKTRYYFINFVVNKCDDLDDEIEVQEIYFSKLECYNT
ncbi:tetratricopeptide repeat protein [Hymenobacter weizhouensis]|uniref:hypothetical protein n=1 Tax=Hymenobacter sp. YIM 151500-1 TaxID=2987689 RepID=UPI002225FB21|nr:hypothetical protein [Hymenobacter sp. YIM 151500-1]UYZ64199.1 hypothetical protein OIS53_04960 [Hymenobacter sp. YIM 151500-1]